MRRLPGGLAHADIACLIGRLVAYRAGNDRRFLPERGGLRHRSAGARRRDRHLGRGPRLGRRALPARVPARGRHAGGGHCGLRLRARRAGTACPSPSRRRRRRSAAARGNRPARRCGGSRPGRAGPRRCASSRRCRDGAARGVPCTTVSGRSARSSRRAPSSSPTARSSASRTRRSPTASLDESGEPRRERARAASGSSTGDRAAIMLGNRPEYLGLWFGVARAGIVEVPLNTGLRGDMLVHMLNTLRLPAARDRRRSGSSASSGSPRGSRRWSGSSSSGRERRRRDRMPAVRRSARRGPQPARMPSSCRATRP